MIITGMKTWLNKHKPAASPSIHIIMAGSMWSLVGLGLFGTGCWWIITEQSYPAVLLIPLSVTAGIIKSRLVLDKAAFKIAGRIKSRKDKNCVGGFLSVTNWLLVILMIGLGRIIRSMPLSRVIPGVLYAAIGTALFFSSRIIWNEFKIHQ